MKTEDMKCFFFFNLTLALCSAIQEEHTSSCNEFESKIDLPPVDLSLNELEQDDPRLIEAIRQKYLFPPSNLPYNFSSKAKVNLDGQFGQPLVLDAILAGKPNAKNGFFIEAGAFDGEALSNTLLFELKYNWEGLLVEPNPDAFKNLLQKRRKAWSLPNCFSTMTKPEVVEFDLAGLFGGIINPSNEVWPGDDRRDALKKIKKAGKVIVDEEVDRKKIRVQCFPLYSVLLALGNPTVDLLSLDIEGAELQVLKTVPWNKVDVKIIDVEVNHLGQIFHGNMRKLNKLLEKAGFEYFTTVNIDNIYIKKGLDINRHASVVWEGQRIL